jgi:hypothetical protein
MASWRTPRYGRASNHSATTSSSAAQAGTAKADAVARARAAAGVSAAGMHGRHGAKGSLGRAHRARRRNNSALRAPKVEEEDAAGGRDLGQREAPGQVFDRSPQHESVRPRPAMPMLANATNSARPLFRRASLEHPADAEPVRDGQAGEEADGGGEGIGQARAGREREQAAVRRERDRARGEVLRELGDRPVATEGAAAVWTRG